MDPARDKIIAGPLGRRFPEKRRFDLQEPVGAQVVPGSLGRLVAEAEQPLFRRPPEVDVTVFHPQVFRSLDGVGDLERRHLGGVEDLEFERLDLDLARRHVLIGRPGRPPANNPSHADDVFGTDLLGGLEEFRSLGRKDRLDEALAVPEVDEQEAAHIPLALDPAESVTSPPAWSGRTSPA